MRLVLATVVAALACAVLVGSGAAAPPSPFTGPWVAIDVDGSNMRMRVLGSGASGVHWIVWYDDGASVCDPDDPPDNLDVPALIVVRTTVAGDTMTGTARIFCLDGSTPEQNDVSVTWTAAGGVLTDTVGVTWYRP